MAPKKPRFDQKKEVRKLARERVGIVKPSRPIEPDESRKKPKHKKEILDEAEAGCWPSFCVIDCHECSALRVQPSRRKKIRLS